MSTTKNVPTLAQLQASPVGSTCVLGSGLRYQLEYGGSWRRLGTNGGVRRNTAALTSIDLQPHAVELIHADGFSTVIPIQDLGPIVYGNGLTHLTRLAFERAGLTQKQVELLSASIGCVGKSVPAQAWLAIATREADIEGDDQQGFKVVYRAAKLPTKKAG